MTKPQQDALNRVIVTHSRLASDKSARAYLAFVAATFAAQVAFESEEK